VPDDHTPEEVTNDTAKIHQAAAWANDNPGRALAVAHAHLRSHSPVVVLGAMCLASEALYWLDRYDDALAAADAAAAVNDRSAQAHWRKAVALYRLGRFREAADDAVTVTDLAPGCAKAWELRGQIVLWNYPEKVAHADKFFQRACELDPQGCALPFRVSRARFKAMIRDEREQFFSQLGEHDSALPNLFQTHLKNVHFEVRGTPSPRDVMNGLDPDIMGTWIRSKEGETSDLLPRLTLGGIRVRTDPYLASFTFFQRNCENICSDEASLRKAIHATLLAQVNGAIQQNVHPILLKGEQPKDGVGPEDAP
jgi:hypothetical protein